MSKTFLILGGYGNVGRGVAECLLRETEVRIILAGRQSEKAHLLANTFNHQFKTQRVTARKVDAAHLESLRQAFQEVDLVVVASSTLDYVENVVNVALETHIDYVDTQLSSIKKINLLNRLRHKIEQAGCCFITDGGFHPGIPATLIRYASSQFDFLEQAQVASLLNINWKELSFSQATWIEFLEELKSYQPLIWQENQWMKLSWNTTKKFDFGPPWGKKSCLPMFLEELRELPKNIPSLKDMGFFMAGFNWLSDDIVIPLSFIFPAQFLGKPLLWSLRTLSKPPFGSRLLLQAWGEKDGKKGQLQITLFHENAYVLTAVPIVACLLQYLQTTLHRPGVWFQAHFVEPKQFLSDLNRMGIQVESYFSS